MKTSLFLAIAVAIAFHAGFILFGGMLFANQEVTHGNLEQVDLLSETSAEKEKPKEEQTEAKANDPKEIETEKEQPPDASEIVKNLEMSSVSNAPALEAASLSSIEAALSGQEGGGGEFSESLSFASGGRIGGTGKAGSLGENLENAFSLGEIDQKPRVLFQATPTFPQGMGSVEGVVTILFIVDLNGKVMNPKVEKSTHKEFEKPALDAVKQWKFEPAIKGGERVSCKMRVPIRFKAK